ncbi:hypothetical protein GOP47_0027204 [Adiantum capillus-veneris]|nr:hypothetical protein GOP47_0027204 [Adiantum capillus-veneris]
MHGKPASKSKTGNWKACFLIFGCEVCERVAFYAISSNLVIYLTRELHEGIAESARNVNNWTGTTFLTPLIGAFLADACLGRYWTLTLFLCGYFLALVLVTMAVSLPSLKPFPCQRLADNSIICPPASKAQIGFFYFALYLMALGAGGIKSNVSSFAGDQFDEMDPIESKRKMSFLNWWFVSISFGTMLSVSLLVYAEENLGWSSGYGAAMVATGIAAALFFLGTPAYRHQMPSGSPITRVAQVVVAASRKWHISLPVSSERFLYEVEDGNLVFAQKSKLPHSNEFEFLDRAAVMLPDDSVYSSTNKPNPWMLCPVTQVEEVKLLIRMLPIWVTNLIFSAVFAQVGTLFLSQGTTMNRSVGPHFDIPAASFPLFITMTICILLPLYDKYFVPFARRITGHERGLTILQRIGIGQVISTISIGAAALVEMKRLRVARDHGLADHPRAMVPMTIFWLLPQYVLTGVCEVFISVGQLEFFYDQAPDSMRSLGAALYLSTIAIGSFISGLLVTIVCNSTSTSDHEGWIGNNLNDSHLDYFYWLLTGISSLNCVLYVACARWYTYKNVNGSRSASSLSSSSSPSSSSSSLSSDEDKGSISCVRPLTANALGYKELWQ